MSESAGLEDSTRPVLERALRFKERLRAGEVAFGAWMTLTDPAVAEIMADLGFDYIKVDALRHTQFRLRKPRVTRVFVTGRAVGQDISQAVEQGDRPDP